MVDRTITPHRALRDAVDDYVDLLLGLEDVSGAFYERSGKLLDFGFTDVLREMGAILADPLSRRQVGAAAFLLYARDFGAILAAGDAETATDTFAKALKSTNPDLQLHAVKIAGALGFASKSFVGVLKRFLKSDVPDVRVSAAAALAGAGEISPQIVTELGQGLADDDIFLCQMAARGYGRLKIRQQGKDGAVQHLISRLDRPERLVRVTIVNALGQIGKGAAESVERLIGLFQDRTVEIMVRATVVRNLPFIAPDSPDVKTCLLKALNDESWEVVYAAGQHLFGPTSEIPQQAIQTIAGLLNSESVDLRMTAARVLDRIGPQIERVLPILIDRLAMEQDEDVLRLVTLRVRAAGATAIPFLIESLKEMRVRSSMFVLNLLSEIGESVVPPILDLLKTTTEIEVQRAAAYVLYLLGPLSVPAVPDLMELMCTGDRAAVSFAVVALAAIGPGGKAAAEALAAIIVFAEDDKDLVAWAEKGLLSIGPIAIPELEKILGTSDEPRRVCLHPILSQLKRMDSTTPSDPLAWIKDDAAIELFALSGAILRDRGATSTEQISMALANQKLNFAQSAKPTLIGKKWRVLETLLTSREENKGQTIRLVDRKRKSKGKLTAFGLQFLKDAERSLAIRIAQCGAMPRIDTVRES